MKSSMVRISSIATTGGEGQGGATVGPPPARLDADVLGRRRALNWVIAYARQKWDDVSMEA